MRRTPAVRALTEVMLGLAAVAFVLVDPRGALACVRLDTDLPPAQVAELTAGLAARGLPVEPACARTLLAWVTPSGDGIDLALVDADGPRQQSVSTVQSALAVVEAWTAEVEPSSGFAVPPRDAGAPAQERSTSPSWAITAGLAPSISLDGARWLGASGRLEWRPAAWAVTLEPRWRWDGGGGEFGVLGRARHRGELLGGLAWRPDGDAWRPIASLAQHRCRRRPARMRRRIRATTRRRR